MPRLCCGAQQLVQPRTIHSFVETAQVAPTILKILGLDPNALDAVRMEGTPVLPAVQFNGNENGNENGNDNEQ